MFAIAMPTVTTVSAEEKVKVEVKNESGETVRPDLDMARVELVFSDVQNGTAHVLLHSPEQKFFPSTDFPWVEGTKLIDSAITIEQGKASFDYIFPIRGEYLMAVDVMDDSGALVYSQNVVIRINENPQEIRNAILFIGLLAAFGLLAGWILSGRRIKIHAV